MWSLEHVSLHYESSYNSQNKQLTTRTPCFFNIYNALKLLLSEKHLSSSPKSFWRPCKNTTGNGIAELPNPLIRTHTANKSQLYLARFGAKFCSSEFLCITVEFGKSSFKKNGGWFAFPNYPSSLQHILSSDQTSCNQISWHPEQLQSIPREGRARKGVQPALIKPFGNLLSN